MFPPLRYAGDNLTSQASRLCYVFRVRSRHVIDELIVGHGPLQCNYALNFPKPEVILSEIGLGQRQRLDDWSVLANISRIYCEAAL
ncbi:protein of unknown function [Bradyrhizobium vignae]|uniref:Uncharacterized protein n=1 Tax=Bradyrhizobium vignae TaxID=1549949 RepID=A0A2U3PU56_9BRAD|nr:protein of unknown function [Bradyrhizobium vignae]